MIGLLVAHVVRVGPDALDDLLIVAEAGLDVVRSGTDEAEAMIATMRGLADRLRKDGGAVVLTPSVAVHPRPLGSVALPLEGDDDEVVWDFSPVVGAPRDCDGGVV